MNVTGLTGGLSPGCWKHAVHTGTSHFSQPWRRNVSLGEKNPRVRVYVRVSLQNNSSQGFCK